jgi:hypothetical protein
MAIFTREEKRIAFHEAGHAVMAFLLKRRFMTISMIPDEGSSGRVHVPAGFVEAIEEMLDGGELTIEKEHAIKDHIRILWAGIESEGVHFGRRSWGGFEHDMQAITTLVLFLHPPGETSDRLVAYLRSHTRDLLGLKCYRKAVTDLAGALLEKKEFGARLARKIIHASFTADMPEFHILDEQDRD